MKIKLKFVIISFLLLIISIFVLFRFYLNRQDAYVYYGHGEHWMGTYTVTQNNGVYYESLYIQYLYDTTISLEELELLQEEIGLIDYQMVGNLLDTSSASPKELIGYLSYLYAKPLSIKHQYRFDKTIRLTIKWQDKEETIVLERTPN